MENIQHSTQNISKIIERFFMGVRTQSPNNKFRCLGPVVITRWRRGQHLTDASGGTGHGQIIICVGSGQWFLFCCGFCDTHAMPTADLFQQI